MKIKYSNKVKEQLSWSTIQEIVQLSFSIIPYHTLHIFMFEELQNNEICITHKIPMANIERKIYLSRPEITKENIILLRTKDTIYIFTENEYVK